MRAIILEDEISAANTLMGMLETFCPRVEVLCHARSINEGILAVQKAAPDLVFLDIEMPPLGNGFDFLSKFKQRSFGLIFTTAYPEYAIKAINEGQPWGYLVKPYSDLELVQAVQVATEQIGHVRAAQEAPASSPQDDRRIVVADQRKGNCIIRVADIVYCAADGATTDIFYKKENQLERITACRTLKDIEQELPAAVFCRTHHSYLVNLNAVVRFEKTGRNGAISLLYNQRVDISVLKMEQFQAKFDAFLKYGMR